MPPHGSGYRAFISYSHADTAVARWLHRALESYRIPSRLVGRTTGLGEVPARLTPIFRDRDELAAAGDLSDALRQALGASLFLVVVASPAAARSRWVDEEVRHFKQVHGEGRVLALIAAGCPGGGDGSECFPPSLRFRVGADGSISTEPAEPIAVDLRAGGDGKRMAKLKLVAGLTGLPLDALVQREAARRHRRLTALAAVAATVALSMSVLALMAVRGQAEAERQRAEADGLVEFMLTDLRAKLEPVGRLEIFDSVGQRALTYYGRQELKALDADALGRRARALHLVGEVRELRGNSGEALEAFVQAERTTAELLARAPDDPQRIFDHAQSVYWVAYIGWQRNDLEQAEHGFREYDRLAAQLVALDPTREEWLNERASSQSNLGALLQRIGRHPEATDHFRQALAMSRELAKAAPADRELQWALAQAHAWLGDSLMQSWQFADAARQRQQELSVYETMLVVDPRDAKAREGKSVALAMIADLQLMDGELELAHQTALASHEAIVSLAGEDPENQLWREMVASITNRRVEALMLDGRWQEAEQLNRQALALATALVATDPSVADWRTDVLMSARWMDIAIAFALHGPAAGRAGIARFRRDFGDDLDSGDSSLRMPWVAVLAMDAIDQANAGQADAARERLVALQAQLPPTPQPRTQAVLRYLRGEMPLHLPADDAPAPAVRLGYDPGVILQAAKGS
ncbi:TIR domain-containing protein [Pseudoxanthomonas suwonensis]|uniref:TIR domain-containing protein n=1 Tax=Pseudoxanthomonas suwonensis TaxID=314722 RepID=UPI000698073D|nr:TIR domain-containing protein [Pseudoxanthomonas suwonensis]